MKDAILLELARRWEFEVKVSEECLVANPNVEIEEATIRATKRECADALKTLVSLLGDVKCP